MRLFFGIYPSPEILTYCRDVYRHFNKEQRNLKQILPEQLHITIRFVGGRVSDQSKNLIIAQLKSMRGTLPQPEIIVEGVQFGFPRQYDPRILFATIKPTPELVALEATVNNVIKKLGLRDTATFKPRRKANYHISIARFKPAATRSSGRDVKELLSKMNLPLPPSFVPTEMTAIQSILNSKSKPVYQKLEQITL